MNGLISLFSFIFNPFQSFFSFIFFNHSLHSFFSIIFSFIPFHPLFLSKRDDSLRETQNTLRLSAISYTLHQDAPSKVGDVIVSLGPWSTPWPLPRGCRQQGLPLQIFLGHSGHVAEALYLGSVYSEKWLDISGFTNFTFCRKVPRHELFKKSRLCRLHLRWYFQPLLKNHDRR